MFDLDHFKNINDTYGHLAGDYVLKYLASAVKGRIRREDVFARYGGEEFAIVLPEISVSTALTFAEKVRQLVEQHEFRFEKTRIEVTISMGVAGDRAAGHRRRDPDQAGRRAALRRQVGRPKPGPRG